MIDVLIRNDGAGWDWVYENGDLVLVSDADGDDRASVAQSVTYALMVWRGECVYDVTAGVPYLDVVFDGPVAGVSSLLAQYAIEAEGASEFLEAPTYLLEDRLLTQSLVVLTAKGAEARLALEVTP